jgi:hypothetical protein
MPSQAKPGICPAPGKFMPFPADSGRIGADIHWLADHKPFADNPKRFFAKFGQALQRFFQRRGGMFLGR